MEYEYDITLSFAGEDRVYVDKVANYLKEKGISVFYDKFELVNLWGKDLGLHFDNVYRKMSRYCVPFISEHYKKKIWTNHEIKTAIARAIENNEDYILPARFDETEIDGIRSTIGYINLQDFKPEEFAELIISKVQGENNDYPKPTVTDTLKPTNNVYLGIYTDVKPGLGITGVHLQVVITNKNKEPRYFVQPRFKLTEDYKGANSFSILSSDKNFPIKLEFGQQFKEHYTIESKSYSFWREFPKESEFFAIVETTVGEIYVSNYEKVESLINAIDLV